MKLLSFSIANSNERRSGLLVDDNIFALEAPSLEECVAMPHDVLTRLIEESRERSALPLSEVTLHAPVQPRKNVFCVGRNYQDHAAEGARAFGRELKIREVPEFFSKAVTAIADPAATLKFQSSLSREYDWEGELGVIIGEPGRDIAEEDALEHVFGYTCINDITARNLQRAHGQWFKGKSLDQSCPIGPWIVTSDEIGDPQQLTIEVQVNGDVKQRASTASMIFPVARIVAELSRGMTLDPADVIATGTPAGVGFARTPPEYLQNGDEVEVKIERIGTLRNTIAIA
ncbi:MAG: fumarylacetoacetate hydrolase family protein [Candidatus Eremiobacteraeota bacterium]|nr:fumarylacetoacetate hydrolase family protein [Candidatus Eremiobacteraeota bacterium]